MATVKYVSNDNFSYTLTKLVGKTDSRYSLKSHTHNLATSDSNGLMSKEDKKKLDGIVNGGNAGFVQDVLTGSFKLNPDTKLYETVIKHPLKSKNLLMDVYEIASNESILFAIDYIDDNSFTLIVNKPDNVKVIMLCVEKTSDITNTFAPALKVSIKKENWIKSGSMYISNVTHNLASAAPYLTILDINGNAVINSYKVLDNNTIQLIMSDPIECTVSILSENLDASTTTPSTMQAINVNLDSSANVFTASNVDGALIELYNNINAISQSMGQTVNNLINTTNELSSKLGDNNVMSPKSNLNDVNNQLKKLSLLTDTILKKINDTNTNL